MQYLIYNGELYHHGIKGMKWGVRRTPEQLGHRAKTKTKYSEEDIYRQKLSKILNNKKVSKSDAQRFKYRNHGIAYRVGSTAAQYVASSLLQDAFSGHIHRYASMSKAELAKEFTKKASKIAVQTAATVALKDALAKSASKNYDNNGNVINGRKTVLLNTKEDWIEKGVGTAVRIAPIVSNVCLRKMSTIANERRTNQEQFERWGQNILSEKVDNVIWQSNDLRYAVIDNRSNSVGSNSETKKRKEVVIE